MSSPLYDASSAPNASSSAGLTPRQRLESVLAHLPPPAGSLAAQEQQASNVIPPTNHGELVKPVQRINEVMRSYGVEFHLQEYGNRVVTRIVDRDSGEVIRQVPSEEVLRIAESLEQLQGRLIQLKA